MRTVTMPIDVLNSLSAGLVRGTADEMLDRLLRLDAARLSHPGDGFGRVLAWTWQEQGEGQAALLVADLLAMLREHHPRAEELQPRITLDELVSGLRLALPGAMSDQEVYDVLTAVRQRVPGFYAAANA